MPFLVDDPSGRGPGLHSYALRGVLVLALLAMVCGLALAHSRGAFREKVIVQAQVSGVGDGLEAGADVKVRGVPIGTVRGVRTKSTRAGRRFLVDLEIRPEHVEGIGRSARARVVPSNVFGAPSVQLVVKEGDRRPFPAGAVIPADRSAEGLMLQTAYATMGDLLAAVQPSKVNAILTALAQAFEGRGDTVGKMLAALDSYATELNGHSGTFSTSLRTLAVALEGLQQESPGLLDTVESFVVTSRTLVEKEPQLAATLGATADTAGLLDRLVRENAATLDRLVEQGAAIVDAVSGTSSSIPGSFVALRGSLERMAEVLRSGLVLSLRVVSAPFDSYTAADCPRYEGLAGPNCGRR